MPGIGQVGSLDEEQFEEFLAEAANRIFYLESYLPTPLLLDKLKAIIFQEMKDGSLQELHAFAKEGLCAYRLPWPKGNPQEDGSEVLRIDDFAYNYKPIMSTTTSNDQKKLEAFMISSLIIDEMLNGALK